MNTADRIAEQENRNAGIQAGHGKITINNPSQAMLEAIAGSGLDLELWHQGRDYSIGKDVNVIRLAIGVYEMGARVLELHELRLMRELHPSAVVVVTYMPRDEACVLKSIAWALK